MDGWMDGCPGYPMQYMPCFSRASFTCIMSQISVLTSKVMNADKFGHSFGCEGL